MTKRMLTMLLAAAMLLAATGCTPSNTAENSSSSSATTEELQVLQEENEKLKQELAELKGEASSEDPDAGASDSDSDADDDDVSSSQTSTPATNNNSSASANTQAPAANNDSSSAAASKPNNQAAASKPVGNNAQTASSTPVPQKTSTGKGPLAKYTVRVKDKTTPAVNVQGELYEGELAYVFYSDSGKVLGTVPDSAVGVILRQEGLTQAEDDEQKSWFVENFNIYRGLDGGSYEVGSGSTGGGSTSSSEIDIEEFRQEVIRLTNKERKKEGLAPLETNSSAMEYAQIRAEEISNKFSHIRPGGKDSDYDGLYFMENIASGSRSPEAVVTGWMNSPGHRATLLSDYTEAGDMIGVGCYKAENGTLYWTQEFVAWDANA